MTRILCRVLVCPFIGHTSESQFASYVCGRCGKFHGGKRRGALSFLLFWGTGGAVIYGLTTGFSHFGWYR